MNYFLKLKKQISDLPIFDNPLFVKYDKFIVPGIVLIIAILILTLVTIPQFIKLFDTFKSIDELNAKKAFYQRKISELEGMNLPEMRQDLETALIALPVDKDIPGVVGELLTALNGSGMSLSTITFTADGSASEQGQQFGLKMDLGGTEDSLKNFLERVRVTPRLIKLNSIDIGKGTGGRLSASVGFVTQYQPLPQNIGSVDADVPKISQADQQILNDIAAKIKALPKVTTTESSSSGIGKLNPFN